MRDLRSWRIWRYQDSELQNPYGSVCLFSTSRGQRISRTRSKIWNLTIWVLKLIRSLRNLSLTAAITRGLVSLKDISMGEVAWFLTNMKLYSLVFPSVLRNFILIILRVFTIHLFQLAYFLYSFGCVAPSPVDTNIFWREGRFYAYSKFLFLSCI